MTRVKGPVLVHDSLKLYGIFESIVFEVRHPACEDVSDVRFYAIEGESSKRETPYARQDIFH